MLFGGMFEEPKKSRPKFTLKDKLPHYKYQNSRCNGCKKNFDIENMTVDHIKPLSSGGSEKTSNMQLLCGHCNSVKGDGTMKQLEKKLLAEGIVKATTKATVPAKKASTTKKAPAKSPAKKTPSKKKDVDPFAGILGF